jgi:catalase
MPKKPTLTTTAGAPIADNQNSITAGPRGPVLARLPTHRETCPSEPGTHSRAHGARQGLGRWHAHHHRRHLEIHQGQGAAAGARTPTLARFSTVAGELGAADAERDVRGFALKFYTEEGNWDLVGNNTPLCAAIPTSSLTSSIRRSGIRRQHALADRDVGFLVAVAGSLHQVTILMSDRGLPVSVRHMNGYGSHTYSLINA